MLSDFLVIYFIIFIVCSISFAFFGLEGLKSNSDLAEKFRAKLMRCVCDGICNEGWIHLRREKMCLALLNRFGNKFGYFLSMVLTGLWLAILWPLIFTVIVFKNKTVFI